MIRPISLLIISLFLFFQSCEKKKKADLIIRNAIVFTANESNSFLNTMVINNGRIAAVGNESIIDNYEADTIIDAEKKLILPGFIDSHVHFMQGAANLSSVQLRTVKTKTAFINAIGEFAKTIEPGEWILGGDWDHENWGGELPQKEWVDSVTLDNPIFLNRLDGHMSLANSQAIKIANISNDIISPSGGEIIKLNGEVSGIFKDNATYLIEKHIPDFSPERKLKNLKNAMAYVNSHGITSVHHMGQWNHLRTFKNAHEDSLLTVRIYANLPLSTYEKLSEEILKNGKGDDYLKIGGLKGFVDGSLGSHTAAFFNDFTDKPGDKGFFVNSKNNLYNWVQNADSLGLQVMIHAIGDSANSTLLTIYEEVTKNNGIRDRRFRIEHAQHLSNINLNKFSELGVIPSMQPYHAIDDGRWAEKVIGKDRIHYTYAFKSLLEADAKLAFGSDWFVAPPIPLMGIYAAVTRRTLDDKNPDGWTPDQKISVSQAVKAFTIGAAYASFDESIKGSLETGKFADFVVIDKNIFEVNPNEIKNARILKTYVGGKLVYDFQ